MSVKITPVASAMYLPSGKINLHKIIPSGIATANLCEWELDLLKIPTGPVWESELTARRLARFGHLGTLSEMPGHREGLRDNDPVSLNSALLLQRLIDRSSRRS